MRSRDGIQHGLGCAPDRVRDHRRARGHGLHGHNAEILDRGEHVGDRPAVKLTEQGVGWARDEADRTGVFGGDRPESGRVRPVPRQHDRETGGKARGNRQVEPLVRNEPRCSQHEIGWQVRKGGQLRIGQLGSIAAVEPGDVDRRMDDGALAIPAPFDALSYESTDRGDFQRLLRSRAIDGAQRPCCRASQGTVPSAIELGLPDIPRRGVRVDELGNIPRRARQPRVMREQVA